MSRGRIVIHTDASVKDSWGVSFAFKVKIYKNGKNQGGFRGAKYSEKQMKTTRAEYLSIVYSLKEVAEKIQDPENYRLIFYSDCESAVNKFGNEDDKYSNLVEHYCRFFDSVNAFWIPREENTEADAIARSALERGYNDDS